MENELNTVADYHHVNGMGAEEASSRRVEEVFLAAQLFLPPTTTIVDRASV